MATRTERFWRGPSPAVSLRIGMPLVLLVYAGCGALPFPTDLSDLTSLVEGSTEAIESRIDADVTAVSTVTGLATSLAGTVSGQYSGSYTEEILEVYFDATGVPIAALSRSQFTLDAPDSGTLTTFNLVVINELIFLTGDDGTPMLDESGMPIATGLLSASTGQIIAGSGAFEGATGVLHSDSVVSFTGGSSGLGSVVADLVVTLDTIDSN